MELHQLHVTLYSTWDFRFLSKGDFRVGKQILSFFCCENDLNITQFSQSTCTILRDISSVLNKKTRFRLPIVKTFSFVTILSKFSLTILDDHSVGY